MFHKLFKLQSIMQFAIKTTLQSILTLTYLLSCKHNANEIYCIRRATRIRYFTAAYRVYNDSAKTPGSHWTPTHIYKTSIWEFSVVPFFSLVYGEGIVWKLCTAAQTPALRRLIFNSNCRVVSCFWYAMRWWYKIISAEEVAAAAAAS